MRKFLWGCAVAAAVGFGGAMYFAYANPQSVVAQVMQKAVVAGSAVNPVLLAARYVGDSANTQAAPPCCKAQESPIEVSLPDDPTPVEEPAVNEVAAVIEVPAPPPIVIREQAPDQQVVAGGGLAMPHADNVFVPGTLPASGIAREQCDEAHACPRLMPYAGDEGQQASPQDGLSGITDPATPQVGATEEAETPEAKDQVPVDPLPVDGNADKAEQAPATPDYHHYHQRYQVCPYSGRCVEMTCPYSGSSSGSCDKPSSCTPRTKEEVEVIPAPQLEESEEQEAPPVEVKPKKKVRKTRSRYGPRSYCPKLPAVDTMEFRRSDETATEYTGGPY